MAKLFNAERVTKSGVTMEIPSCGIVGHNVVVKLYLGCESYSLSTAKLVLISANNPPAEDAAEIVVATADGDGDVDQKITITIPDNSTAGLYMLRVLIADADDDGNVFLVESELDIKQLDELEPDQDEELLAKLDALIDARVSGGIDSSSSEEFASAGLSMKFVNFAELTAYRQTVATRIEMRGPPIKSVPVNVQGVEMI